MDKKIKDYRAIKQARSGYKIPEAINDGVGTDFSKIGLEIDTDVEEPGVSFEEGKLTFGIPKPADGKDGKDGKDGQDGASAVFDPETGNILATLESTIGMNNSNAMTQKAVTNELYIPETIIDLSHYTPINQYINGSNVWANSQGGAKSVFVPVIPGKVYKIIGNSNTSYGSNYTLLKSDEISVGNAPNFVDGVTSRTVILPDSVVMVTATSDAAYINIMTLTASQDVTPAKMVEGQYVRTKVPAIEDYVKQVDAKIDTLANGIKEKNLFDKYVYNIGRYNKVSTYIASNVNKWTDTGSSGSGGKFIPVVAGDTIAIRSNSGTHMAFLTAEDTGMSEYNKTPAYAGGATERTFISANIDYEFVVPSDAVRMYIYTNQTGTDKIISISIKSNKDIYMRQMDIYAYYPHVKFGDNGTIVECNPSDASYNYYCIKKYAIQADKDYYADARNGSSINYSAVAYYDSNEDFIGWDNKFNPVGIAVEYKAVKLTVPNGAAYVAIFGSLPTFSPMWVPELYEGVSDKNGEITPLVIEYHEAEIRSNVLVSDKDTDPTSATGITDTIVKSPWAVMWPTSYNPFGKPTQVIAMLHGASGLVTRNDMGYHSLATWNAWRDRYIAEGYAVMDINGIGITSGTTADENSTHYGCPQAVETLDKAFEYLKEHYNVCDKLLVHGTSMGGGLAQTYTMAYPAKVLAVGLFAPIQLMRSAMTSDTVANLWGYEDNAEALADDFANFVGTAPFSKCLAWKDGELMEISWAKIVEDATEKDITPTEEMYEYGFVDKFPVPLRCWQGLSDTTILPQYSKQVIEGYRRAGSNASIRLVDGAQHNLCSGSVQIVIDEAVAWFKRYTNN